MPTVCKHHSSIGKSCVQFIGPLALDSLCPVLSSLTPQPQFRPYLHPPGPSPQLPPQSPRLLQSTPNMPPKGSFYTHSSPAHSPPVALQYPWTMSPTLSLVCGSLLLSDPSSGPVPREKETLLQTSCIPEVCQVLTLPSLCISCCSWLEPFVYLVIKCNLALSWPARPPAVLVQPPSKHISPWTVTFCAGVCISFQT